ncbi:MAG: PAS domain-containing protein [Acidobacteriia bacterium]|nr:PAS domain-containing protein [Terriglobia bacterium]
MKLLSNPVALRMALVLAAAVFAFVMGKLMMRRMRQSIVDDATLTHESHTSDRLPLETYHAVIQELKQQKHELQSLQLVERRRAKTSENISAAILSNLSSGVLFFTPNGLVRQANAAAKQILGYVSPVGMSAAELFREAALFSGREEPNLVATIQASFRERMPFQRLGIRYSTPANEERVLDITVTAVRTPSGDVLGAACLITDQTEIAQIRRQQELRGEMSAEMALELRNSLTTISGYAQQLAANHDPDLARQLAADIAAESAHLDRTIGGFLAGARAAKAAAEG